MFLTISETAQAKIKPLLTDQTRLLLSYDDGVGPYSHHGLVALQVSFQLIVIRADMPYQADYDTTLDSSLGTIYVKGYSTKFLDDRMQLTVQPTYGILELSSDSEMIDDNVELVNLTKNEAGK